jgi:hypothetical protein
MSAVRDAVPRLPLVVALHIVLAAAPAVADEGGVSFWLPGQYGSFAATPSVPGWSFESTFYHAYAAASTSVGFPRGGGLEAGLKSPIDNLMFTPTYTFAQPVLGAQASLGMTVTVGKNYSSLWASVTGPSGEAVSGSHSDRVSGFGDPSPTATLKWNLGDHNVMVYATSGIPVGAYDPNRLSNLGVGHWAVDSGAGYTYLNERAGFELSAVAGLTYNFINPNTQYQNGIDGHLDWAVSPLVTDRFHFGAVGYFYHQLTGDSGTGAALGDFKSRVTALGPQIGFMFPVARQQGYLNIRAYSEFDAKNRLDGWTTWLTFSIEPPEQKIPAAAARR